MADDQTVPTFPDIAMRVFPDTAGEVVIAGQNTSVAATGDPGETRRQLMQVVTDAAKELQRPVRAIANDGGVASELIVSPDGRVQLGSASAVAPPIPPIEPRVSVAPAAAAPLVRDEGPAAPTTRREARQSFLTQEQVEEPATHGVRGVLNRAGLRVAPSDTERAERADVQAVSQHWPGPRTIVVANPKGGVGKTPTTSLLSAVFARYGGAGVLAWDNNQTRGTLGWRTEQGPHDATILDLLPRVDYLLGTSAQSADLASFVHHQTRDRYDVLRSKPSLLAHEQRFDTHSVDAIHAVAAKYYRLIVIDSGNDESDAMWLRAIDQADQLVVATTTRADHAEAGALMLEALAARGGEYSRLAEHSVVVVSQADQRSGADELARVVTGFTPLARKTVTIPFDPAMVDGVLNYASLRPATQRSWLAAGAAVARGL